LPVGQEITPSRVVGVRKIRSLPALLRLPVSYLVPLRGPIDLGHGARNRVPNINETLARLDDQLDDLRRQVARLTEEPVAGEGEHRGADAFGFSVARMSAGRAPAPQAPDRPGGPGAPQGSDRRERPREIRELLVACERLLGEARELMSAHRAQEARPAFFEGTVKLVARGANRLQTVQVLEDSLRRARQVTRVYVRRVYAGEVRCELTLTGGVDLVGELNRVMPFPFAICSATREEIVISLEGAGVEP
jgi:hypothetical protein